MRNDSEAINMWKSLGVMDEQSLSVLTNHSSLDAIFKDTINTDKIAIGVGPAKKGKDGCVTLDVWDNNLKQAQKEVASSKKNELKVSITFNCFGGIQNITTEHPFGKQKPFSLTAEIPKGADKKIELPGTIGDHLGQPLERIVHFGSQYQRWNLEPQV